MYRVCVLQRVHSGDGCDLASPLCKYDLGEGDLFVLRWAREEAKYLFRAANVCACCMFVSCVHPVAVLNAEFCMICNLLMLVEDARGDHMKEAYTRAGLTTAL